MLFSVAVMILIAHWAERTDRKRTQLALLLLPVVLLGARANNRRLAWVEMTLGLLAILAVSRARAWKRALARTALLGAPIILLYLVAGWNSPEGIFGPIRLVKSVTDSSFNRSTWCRHVEDWNLAMSIADRPLLGRGFGHEWTEFYVGDDITNFFPMYKAEPHNMVLGLTLFAGAIGVAFLFMPFAATVFLAARSYRLASTPERKAAALVLIGAVLAILAQTFGDLGPFSTQFRLMTPLAFVLAGKLAGACGAWPTPPPSEA
jgi:O-antigen ligase